MNHSSSTTPNTFIVDTLRRLGGLTEASRQQLAAGARPWRAEPGAVAFDIGDPCRHLLVLAGGAVRVVRPLITGQEILLYRLQPGELCIISASCLLGNTSFPARGIVDGQAHGVLLDGQTVREAAVSSAPFREFVFATFAERLATLMVVLEERIALRLDSRLAALLVAHAPVFHATHQQLAEDLASAREVVSRVLEGFAARGWVILHRARVDVIDVEALTRLAHSTSA